jgi:16S rRNA (uracil1498-N3)-methyltransferase
MSERFFSSQRIVSDRVTLDGPEAHHLLHVMRAAKGDVVTLFDGSGGEFEAVVESPYRADVQLRVLNRREVNRELPFALTVAVALPKGDRQKWLVEKLTELGVAALKPLITERSVSQPTGTALERLERAVIEAAKQCGRNRLMGVLQPESWNAWISFEVASTLRIPRLEIHDRRLVAHSDGQPLAEIDLAQPLPTLLAIGPEGGLTDDELAVAEEAGWQAVSLGSRVLRVETAAVALAAAIALR